VFCQNRRCESSASALSLGHADLAHSSPSAGSHLEVLNIFLSSIATAKSLGVHGHASLVATATTAMTPACPRCHEPLLMGWIAGASR